MKQKLLVFGILIVLVTAALLYSFNRNIPAVTASGSQQTQPTPPQSPPGNAEAALIQAYEQALKEDDLDPGLRNSLEEKLSMAQQSLSSRKEALSEGLPDPGSIEPPQQQQDPAFQPGIYEGGEGLFRASEAVIENYWQGVIAGQYVQVFAGVSGTDRVQGLVVVVTTSQDRLQTDMQWVPVPGETGPVRILEENDLILHLVDADGEALYFDISARAFSSLH